jgi:hypothetical protein
MTSVDGEITADVFVGSILLWISTVLTFNARHGGTGRRKERFERSEVDLFGILLAPYDIRHNTMTYVMLIYFFPHK